MEFLLCFTNELLLSVNAPDFEGFKFTNEENVQIQKKEYSNKHCFSYLKLFQRKGKCHPIILNSNIKTNFENYILAKRRKKTLVT